MTEKQVKNESVHKKSNFNTHCRNKVKQCGFAHNGLETKKNCQNRIDGWWNMVNKLPTISYFWRLIKVHEFLTLKSSM